ncbi:glycerol kinase [Vibrio mediterranei]|uniref:Glycerol kinase n=1 Tax=Vibrio mediterranei TaxID=689 RepID=A0ABX5D8U5_9VIBR|nr:glycerol kinase [Vibrio mediterranei]MCG9659226.1 glycerol kinase [Vibrio mediterranei]MCG9663319.1 glycerol kinase [Vibrio mediterranei]PCD89630.1 glycerol kinase [Vibrio mediterranei]PRQ65453.1 glycerol kinase [Vibrio mediterranei]
MHDKLSTSALAKSRNQESKALFTLLKRAGYISWHESSWLLTDIGHRFGGDYVDSEKYGRFIVWPSNLVIDDTLISDSTLTATQLGEHFALPAKKINLLLSELGWIKRDDSQWKATAIGLRAGARLRKDKQNNNEFVVWHPSVLRHARLKQSVIEFKGHDAEAHSTEKSFSSFRQKFAAKHRTLDGHYVQSKGELIIDNWLYMAGVVHAYQRQLPIEQDVVSDFYLPQGKVYLQYWGSDSDVADDRVIEHTRALYQEHDLSLIEIFPDDIQNLDELLPKKLKPFGIKAY